MLEIGAGQGSAGALLARRFAYVGLEPDETAFRTAVERIGARVGRAAPEELALIVEGLNEIIRD